MQVVCKCPFSWIQNLSVIKAIPGYGIGICSAIRSAIACDIVVYPVFFIKMADNNIMYMTVTWPRYRLTSMCGWLTMS